MTETVKPRLVIGHPHLGRGGSEARVMWLIEALKSDFDLTVVTTGGWDLDDLNNYYGTKVDAGHVTIRIAPTAVPLCGLEAAALRFAFYQRFAKRIASEYDIRISAYNFTDWGMPAIHFLADFSWDAELRGQLDPPTPGFFYRDTILRRSYLNAANRIRTSSGRDPLHEDLIIANSQWSLELMRKHLDIVCAGRVYPPVWTEYPQIPWEQKEFAFVMIGRIAPEKRLERAISILNGVRQRGHAIKLHLCGKIGNDFYGRRIARLCRKFPDWIVPEGLVQGKQKAGLLASCRYGIQARDAEPFGIAVAEMIKAGAVVFAPGSGGQSEILNSPELLFNSNEEAVTNICSVLGNCTKQLEMRDHLIRQSAKFSSRTFQEESRALVLQPTSHEVIRERSRPKVVIGHPHLGFGGSESVVMWLIEALKNDFDVTVMTTGGWDLTALNSFYGTQVKPTEVTIRTAPIPHLARKLRAAALRGACYQRFARKIAEDYDLRVSAYNLTDWGQPAIHFLGDFGWHDELRTKFHPQIQGYIYKDTIERRMYLSAAKLFARPSGRDVLRDDFLIANSHWTAAVIKNHFGVDCGAVVNPPVWEEFPNVDWEQRENAFVMIGRIAPEKRVERAIDILQSVRRRGHAIKFYLCGQIDSSSYGKRIEQLSRKHAEWIFPLGRVIGSEKVRVLSHCRFGIQACDAEAFGISAAEMVKAGSIVFAPASGGQSEIINCRELLFSGNNDAVEKICAVLSNPEMQASLKVHLAEQAISLNARNFVKGSRELVAHLLDQRSAPCPPAARIASITM